MQLSASILAISLGAILDANARWALGPSSYTHLRNAFQYIFLQGCVRWRVSWAQNEFKTLDLGDGRLTARVIPKLGNAPEDIAQATGCWNRLECSGDHWTLAVLNAQSGDGQLP